MRLCSGRSGGAFTLLLIMAGGATAAPRAMDFDQRLSAVEQALGAASSGGSQSQAQLVIQLQQMQAELRQLRGMVEESANQVQQLQKRQREFYLDLDGRLSALESGGTAVPRSPQTGTAPPAAQPSSPQLAAGSEVTPPAPPAADAAPVERPIDAPASTQGQEIMPPVPQPGPAVVAVAPGVNAGEQEAYRAASDLLRIGRYDEAITGFQAQLSQYPGGALSDNAQYWIGEAYYVTRQFDRALAEFQRVAAEYPQSPKAADALLKVGYIQYERREFAAARQTLDSLKTTWPNSPAARLAENRLRRMQEEGV